jgi:hypothetical protein
MSPRDELELQGLFMPDLDVSALVARIRQAGVPEEQIHVLSPLPLSNRASDRIGGVPLYGSRRASSASAWGCSSPPERRSCIR